MKKTIFAWSQWWQKNTILKSISKQPKVRYADYSDKNASKIRFMFPFANFVARDFLTNKQLEIAIRVNAEICFSQGTGYMALQWKERLLLVGLLAAYARNFDQAACWLAAGVCQTQRKLISRCSTYGYSNDFVDWVHANKGLMTTAQGWSKILNKNSKNEDDFTLLIFRLATMVHIMGLENDVAALLPQINRSKFSDWKKIFLSRLPGSLDLKTNTFTQQEIWAGSYHDILEKIQLNILNRVFAQPNSSSTYVTSREKEWLLDNNFDFINSHKFHLLCKAFQNLYLNKPTLIVDSLADELESNATFFDKLSQRQGPLRVFVGGYGWTGSGAIFDSLRGYPLTKEMLGAGNIKYLNKGAESEPMVHQGPAGILDFANQINKTGEITGSTWRQFFRLYVLMGLSREYFEYKTVHANKLICNKLGSNSYYLLLMQNLNNYAKISNINGGKEQQIIALKQFESNLVKALFENDNDVVLFNNSINTHNINTLTYLNGRSVYIAVNRSIFDQLADQRKSNIFFNTAVKKFARIKSKKMHQYFSTRNKLDSLIGVQFYDVQFEDWVQDHKYRSKITKEVLGTFSPKHDSKHFTPALSIKNINIYNHNASPEEKALLDSLVAKNKHLC